MTDDELFDRLHAALQTGPVPAQVVRDAEAAFALNDLDAELAALVADSLTSSVRVRGDAAARVLSFAVEDVTIDLDVSPGAVGLLLVGTITGGHGPATLETLGGARPLEIDARGRFLVDDVPAGPLRVRVTTPHGPVVTSWVSV